MSVQETSFLVLDTWLPKVTYSSKVITARSSLPMQLVTLFSSKRGIKVCNSEKLITISTRRWWFKTTVEKIPFAKVRYIDVSQITVGGSPGLTQGGFNWRDQQENFIPYVMSVDGTKIDLIGFLGEGSVLTGWGGVLLGDEMVDFRGKQEEKARKFASAVAMLIGVPCGIESKVLAEARSTDGKLKCPSCSHLNAINYKKCLYCGADITMA